MSDNSLETITRREFLKRTGKIGGAVALGSSLSGCTGSFSLLKLNNAESYDKYSSNEDINEITFAYLNIANLRGNTKNIWQIITKEQALFRAKYLADFLVESKVDVFCASEVDYKGTSKTGGINQPEEIAHSMGSPYDYVVLDEYFKTPCWTTGNGMISRYPMKPLHRHIYDKDDWIFGRLRHVFKDFIHVGVKVGKRNLDVIVNHFDDGLLSVRMDESRELLNYATRLKEKNPNSFIVCPGDYNSTKDSRPIKKLLSTGILHPPSEGFGHKTYQNENPERGIDHIFSSSNVHLKDYRTFHFPYSDHLGLICKLGFRC